jgi:hypothetical protein
MACGGFEISLRGDVGIGRKLGMDVQIDNHTATSFTRPPAP